MLPVRVRSNTVFGQIDLPNATLSIVADCGHFLQEERPDEVTDRLLEFLSVD